jgi:hypothetical protein
LKNEKIVIEVKMGRKQITDEEIGEQLLVDIDRYSGNQGVLNPFCSRYQI